jgi:23S rRNA (uracil1939-C5)-methyltransferase
VVGIEQVHEAVEDARRNAARNHIDNCTFLVDRTEVVLEELCAQQERFDVIVADPPRAGIHKKALAGMVALGPATMIYISCNAETLAEDLLTLLASGYDIRSAQPVEMFPHTPHCEILTWLSRSGRWSGELS